MTEIECHVCMEDFSAQERIPKVLPCGHTYCKVCLENMTSGGQLRCPTCKRHHKIPVGGTQELITNHRLLDLVDRFCNNCKKLGDTKRCYHCPCQLCTDCFSDHIRTEVSKISSEMVDTASDLLNSLDTKMRAIYEILVQYRTFIDTSRVVLEQNNIDRAVAHIYEQIQICTESMIQLDSAIQIQLGRVDLTIPVKTTHSRGTDARRGKAIPHQRGASGSKAASATELTPGGAHKVRSRAVSQIVPSCSQLYPRVNSQIFQGRLSNDAERIRKSCSMDSQIMHGGLRGQLKMVMPDTYNAEPSRIFGSKGSAADQFDHPRGVAWSMRGDVLIADFFNKRVCVYDSNYQPKLSISVLEVRDLCVMPSGDVAVVCDASLMLFTATGQLLWNVGRKGKKARMFSDVRGITCDSTGNIYVCDYGNDRLQAYKQSGVYIRCITGEGNNIIKKPVSVAVHPMTGRLYVAEESKRVSIFTANGCYEGCIADIPGVGGLYAQYLSFRNDGLLALSDYHKHCIYLLRFHQLVHTIGHPGSPTGLFRWPRGTVFTAGGELVVCDELNHRLHVFNCSG